MSASAPDSLGFHDAARRVPEATEAAILAAQDAALPDIGDITAVAVVGDAGARWPAEVVAAIAAARASVPVYAPRFGEASPSITAGTLVVRIATAGPPRSPGHCSVGVGPVDIPLGVDVPHARSALGALCAAPLAVIERLGLARDIDVELDHAVAQLHHRRARSIGTGIGTDTDVATLARRIGRLFPLVYGEGPIGGLAALRWKQQCNTNAKSPAFAAALPDLAADEIAGWGQHGDVTRQVFCGVVLRHDHELAGGDARFAALDAVLDESLAAVHEWRAAGDGPLAQLLDLAYAGDLLSLHLAAQEGLDPGPAPALDLLRY